MEDKSLPASMRQDDRSRASALSEFEDAYREHFGMVWRFAALSTRNREDADEIAQDVFERGLLALSKGGPAPESWKPWLLTVTRRLLTSRHRHHRILRWVPIDNDRNDAPYSNCFAETELNLWLDQITRLLPAKQREVLFLRYVGDLDDVAVGKILGLSRSGVRSLVSRAIAQLRMHEELWR